MQKIGDVIGRCSNCGWEGTVDEAVPDVDGDGSLGCEQCLSVVRFFAPTDLDHKGESMSTKSEQEKTFQEVVKPAMEWLAKNKNPHARIIIEATSAELVEGVESFVTDEFIPDGVVENPSTP